MHVFDVWKIRKHFPILKRMMNNKPLVYLDGATTTQKPQVVIDAIKHFCEEEYGSVHRAVYGLASDATEKFSNVREKIQHFIHAREKEEIIFTRGTTESINLVAHSFGKRFVQEGDEIILSIMEHHSNILPWQLFCKKHGAKIKIIPITLSGELCLDTFEQILNDKTKLVSIAHVANTTGTINPIKKVINMAHHYGAKVLIDGAQAASHLHIDVQDLDADFYAFSGHKMYGPTGIGVLYGKRELLEEMPPFMGGGDMVDEVFIERATFQGPPLKFEAGTPPIIEVIGLGRAIDYIQSIGRTKIDAWKQQLLTYAIDKIAEVRGIQIIGQSKKKSAILSFTLEGVHPLDLGMFLGFRGIAMRTGHLCAQPTLRHFGIDSLARLTFDLYNTYEEIDLCIQAIKEAIPLLKSHASNP